MVSTYFQIIVQYVRQYFKKYRISCGYIFPVWKKIKHEDSDIEVFELEEHLAAQKLNCFLCL